MSEAYEDATWFLAHEQGADAGPRLVSLCNELSRRQQTLIRNSEMCMSIFEYGGDARNLQPGEHMPLEDALMTFNAAQNVVETVYSKVIKSRIIPMPLTEGGGYLQRHRAKQLGKAIEGVIDDNDGEQIEEDVVLDALTTDHGAGAILVREQNDEVKLEHIPVEDIWFDEAEIRYRQPRSCYRVPKGGMDKYVAISLFAKRGDEHPGLIGTAEEREAAILAAANKPATWRQNDCTEAKARVDIFEAWHLPSGPIEECDEEYEDEESGEKKTRPVRKHDGRHVVAVDGPNGTLIDEPWEGPKFPVLLYVPRRRRRSVWGLSLMRDLVAPQREYEKLTVKIQHQHQKMGVSGFAAPQGANVNVREITAGKFGAGFVLDFDGQTPPIPLVPEPVAQGTYAYSEGIVRAMAERKGVSTLATASQLPAGLQQASGKALQVFEDFEDVRLLPYHRERERFKIALSWLIIYAAKRIVERGVKYKARYRDKHGFESIDWSEVLKDADTFVLRVFPVSSLSKQPAARFAQLTELLNTGAITVEQFKRLYDMPDLEAENELDTADTEIVMKNLDTMVVTGRYVTPLSTDPFMMQIALAGKFVNLCRLKDVPEERLKLVLDYIEDTKALKDQADEAAAAKAAPPAGPMGPPGMPPPPPDGGLTPPDAGMPPMPPGIPPAMAA